MLRLAVSRGANFQPHQYFDSAKSWPVLSCACVTASRSIYATINIQVVSCLFSPTRHIIKIHRFFLRHLMSCNGALSSIIFCRNTTNTSASTNRSPLMTDAVSSIATTCLVEQENLFVNIETLLVHTSCSQFCPYQIRCTDSSRCFDVQFLFTI